MATGSTLLEKNQCLSLRVSCIKQPTEGGIFPRDHPDVPADQAERGVHMMMPAKPQPVSAAASARSPQEEVRHPTATHAMPLQKRAQC
mmetsp:Transcript_1234/g.3814  ORF Transcript_1234/g.3814 Transcript_1234/m.3814 type:complete len:88 (+) Transcript_1234:2016-2279(+)